MDRVLAALARPRAEACTRVAVPIGRAIALFSRWRDRVRQRRQLARLTARERADIGITRLDVARECAKPFWRA
jgi:uncharacterized protein YjiS (DUF1127 family)